MTVAEPIRVLLGPQSPHANIGEAVANAALPDGPLAVISAGWQEAEGDIDDLRALVGRPLEELYLYRRAEEVAAGAPQLKAARRQRQDRLIAQQRIYRLRLRQLSIAARHTLGAEGDADMIAAEQRHAIAQLRALDRHHLRRSESIWRAFNEAHGPESDAALARHAQEIGDTIDRCAGVLITGGNIAILINRMRLFGVERLLRHSNVVAWSAGAMALAKRIVLFHEHSPEGRRDAEVLGAGCGVLSGQVFLPDTQHRLRAGERRRVELLCRRFAPETCIALDNGAELHLDAAGVRRAVAVRRLNRDGRFVTVRAR